MKLSPSGDYVATNVPASASPLYSMSIACLKIAAYSSAHASAYEVGIGSSLAGVAGTGGILAR